MNESFGATLRSLRIRAGLSQNTLANEAGVDPAYVNRMERAGQIQRGGALIPTVAPRRTVVCALGQVLQLDAPAIDRLLYAAGLAPSVDWQSRAEAAEARLTAVRAAIDGGDEPVRLERVR